MVKIREICEALENWAPLKFQESYDNSGLIVGDKDRVIDIVNGISNTMFTFFKTG